MPENWPPNIPQTPEKTPAKIADTKKVEMRNEIIKLKTEILKEERRIATLPNKEEIAIAQNLLEEKNGRLKIMIDKYSEL